MKIRLGKSGLCAALEIALATLCRVRRTQGNVPRYEVDSYLAQTLPDRWVTGRNWRRVCRSQICVHATSERFGGMDGHLEVGPMMS